MAFLSFDEFSDVLARASGMLVVVLTSSCDEVGVNEGREVELILKKSVSVHLMCAPVPTSPTLVFYEGGDARPLLTSPGPTTPQQLLDALEEAMRIVASRPSVAEEAEVQANSIAQTARMLDSEKLDRFPPFFRMARNLARDAWFAARQTAEGAPLLLSSDAAAARLDVCVSCPSFRDNRCVECGCYMTVKAHIAAMQCPLDKWPVAP
jgi:hypothetical protein